MSEPAAPSDAPLVAVSGNIAAGKSTLCAELAEVARLPLFSENVSDNPYLDDFYEDQEQFSFRTQVFFLSSRVKQLRRLSGIGAIQDRTLREDTVFADVHRDEGTMSERDHRTYRDLFEVLVETTRDPDVVIYLNVDPQVNFARMRRRGRACEEKVTLRYLQQLHAKYENFADDMAKRAVVFDVDWNTFSSAEELWNGTILKEYKADPRPRKIKVCVRSP